MTGQAALVCPPQTREEPNRAGRAKVRRPRLCPECLTPVHSRQPAKLFCSAPHKRTYANRWIARGAVLAPIAAAARATRDGTRGTADQRADGRQAARDARLLMQMWKEDDAAAGRLPAVDYMAFRYRHGLVEVIR